MFDKNQKTFGSWDALVLLSSTGRPVFELPARPKMPTLRLEEAWSTNGLRIELTNDPK